MEPIPSRLQADKMKQIDLGNIKSLTNRAIGLKKSFFKIIKRKSKKNGSPKTDSNKK